MDPNKVDVSYGGGGEKVLTAVSPQAPASGYDFGKSFSDFMNLYAQMKTKGGGGGRVGGHPQYDKHSRPYMTKQSQPKAPPAYSGQWYKLAPIGSIGGPAYVPALPNEPGAFQQPGFPTSAPTRGLGER